MIENIIPFVCFIIFFFIISLTDTIPINFTVKSRKVLYYSSFFVLIIFAGCRWSSWEIGYETWIFDYDSYHKVYDEALPLKSFFTSYTDASIEVKQIDIGYLLWNSIAKNIIGDNYNLYLLFTNTIIIILLFAAFKKNNITGGIFFIIFFYASRLYFQYNFTLMRQAISIVIIWYALQYLTKHNLKKYILLVCIATTFHFSAIVCFLFPFLKKIKINTYLYFTILITSIVLGYLGVTNQLIEGVLTTTLNSMGLPISDKLTRYLDFEGESNILNFAEAIPFLYMAISSKNKLIKTQEGKFYYNMLFCYVLLMAITMNFFFITRFWHYMIISYIYILSYYYNSNKHRILFYILTLYFLIYAMRYIMIWFYDVPYSCFLFHL